VETADPAGADYELVLMNGSLHYIRDKQHVLHRADERSTPIRGSGLTRVIRVEPPGRGAGSRGARRVIPEVPQLVTVGLRPTAP
jgi:hypothetical protein